MKRYLTILIQVFPWYVYQIFINRFRPHEFETQPTKVGKYTFVKRLSNKSYPYSIGIYKSPSKKQVVIKIWKGRIKDIYYFNLLHQIKLLKLLAVATKRVEVSKSFGFSIPKLISSTQTKFQVTLIMELVEGKSLQSVSAKKQFEIYTKCIKFLDEIRKKLTATEKTLITTKSALDFVILYPLLLIVAITLNPKHSISLIKGAYYFFNGLPQLFGKKPFALVHGDLHLENILITGSNKYSLIDTENMRLCYPVYEAISTISLKHNPQKLKQQVIKTYINPLAKLNSEKKALRALLVNNLTHYLSGDKNEVGVNSYIKTLDLAFSL